jgi:RNA polymerase sigma factor (sigma-70 family)
MDQLRLRAVMKGQPDAVAEFIRTYGPALRGAIRRIISGPLRAQEEDVMQEILLGLIQDGGRVLRQWDPEGGRSLRTFLVVFAQRRTYDWLRKQQRAGRERPTEDDALVRRADGAVGAEQPEVPEWLALVYDRFCAECSEEDQRILEMYYLEDRGIAEIAAAMGMTVAAVYQRRHRIKERMKKLREELAPRQQGRGTPSDSAP